jgi:uncharacterized OsmC-like protein
MSNLRARESLERARHIFLERPAAAKKANASATAVWHDGLRCNISGPTGEKASSDMPAPLGGEGSAPNPGWFLRASMAACTATSIAIRAARLGVELKLLEVSVESESDARAIVGIEGNFNGDERHADVDQDRRGQCFRTGTAGDRRRRQRVIGSLLDIARAVACGS